MLALPLKDAFEQFANETGRQLHLEIEPGTFLVANAGSIVCEVQDLVSTGTEGYNFIRSNTGMTEILRPSLYGAQHPIHLVPRTDRELNNEKEYVIVGHCCESGDLLSPAPDQTDVLASRELPEAQIGDYLVIAETGAYCAAMATKNYNSFPEAAEVLLQSDGNSKLIRERQTLDQIIQNEC